MKKLKHNDYDPEDEKGNDSEADLFKCKGSGKVAVGRKPWHQDENGNFIPGEPIYDDTGINIDDLPWPKKGDKIKVHDEIRIEFRVSSLTKPIDEILKQLSLVPDKVHRKGEKRGKGILTHSEDWFIYYAADTKGIRFDQAVAGLLDMLHPARQEFQKVCGPHRSQLSCIFYFDSSRRPYIHFTPDVLTKLNDMHAAIDVSVYPMPSDEE